MKILILTSASRDLASGQRFYDRQGEGLGDYFLDSMFADIESLELYAGVHLKIFGFYRLLAKRFPYAIYYQMNGGNNIVVFRVLDCRRDPAKISKELRRNATP